MNMNRNTEQNLIMTKCQGVVIKGHNLSYDSKRVQLRIMYDDDNDMCHVSFGVDCGTTHIQSYHCKDYL